MQEHTPGLKQHRMNRNTTYWEVVRHIQTIQSVLPLVLEHEFIPLGNDIRDWTARIRLTERYATIYFEVSLLFSKNL